MPQADPRDDHGVGRILAKRASARALHLVPLLFCLILSHQRFLAYGEADLESNRMANAMEALGIDRGDTVLVMMPNVVEFILVRLGLGKHGAVQVPVNTACRGNLLAHVRHVGVNVMVRLTRDVRTYRLQPDNGYL